MLGYERCNESGGAGATGHADNYGKWCDRVLPGRISKTDIECNRNRPVSLEHGSHHEGNNGDSFGQLHGDGDECYGMHGNQFSGSSDG
jgi:hypothetical protein